jgi:hypothetical protein
MTVQSTRMGVAPTAIVRLASARLAAMPGYCAPAICILPASMQGGYRAAAEIA